MRHFASAQYWDRLAGGDTGHLFLASGGPVCADRISNCPLTVVNSSIPRTEFYIVTFLKIIKDLL